MAYRSLPLLLLAGTLALCVSGCPDNNSDDNTNDLGKDTGVDAGVDTGVDSGVDTGVDSGTPDMGTNDAGDEPKSITFIHTNDEHSQIQGFAPTLDDYPDLSTDPAIMGGVYRRARTIERLSAEAQTANDPYAVVSAGDVSMGSLFQVADLFASPDYNIQTVLGYDVMTLGNHEFDFGPGILAQMISQGEIIPSGSGATFDTLKIPLVVSNIRFSASSPDDDALAAFWSESGASGQPIARYYIATYGNVRVGYVGYMGLDAALVAPFKAPINFSLAVDPQSSCTNDSECPRSVCIPPASDPRASNGNCALDPTGADPTVNFPALVADVAGAVATVRAMGVDLVVAVSHAGVNEQELAMLDAMGSGPEEARLSEDILVARGVDQALSAQGVRGLDLIIGGHSHTPLPEPIEVPNDASGITTYIVQAGAYGEYVGRIRLTRANSGSPWVTDPATTGLTPINGSVSAQGLGFLTQLVLDGLIDQVIAGLEGQSAAQAGDDLFFPGEQCDGATLPNGGNCLNLVPGATGGTLACETNRQLDVSGCTFDVPNCGNNTVEGNEQCDGTDIPVTCQSYGYDGGTLGCQANCAPDFAQCDVHFPSLLEIALNFGRDGKQAEIRDDPAVMGDLFFYILGQATFDVGDVIPNHESNIVNLVADAERWAANRYSTSAVDQPIEIAITANGIVRAGIYMGATGGLAFADLFRVLPLGISPQEMTPGYTLVDFWLSVPEVKVGLEVGLSRGLIADSFWLAISGARVEYDMSLPEFDPANPLTTGRITRIDLIDAGAGDAAWTDTGATFEETPLFDLTAGQPFDPNRYVHVTTSLYLALFMQGFGLCPRIDSSGTQFGGCGACTIDADCTVAGATCDTTAGVCRGGQPAPFYLRTQAPLGNGFFQELKEILALTSYVGHDLPGEIPAEYGGAVPRRLCCVGSACPTDGSRTCN